MATSTISPVILFAAVGAVATATHVAIALACQSLAGLAPLTANFAAYSCAVCVSYLGNAWLTFNETPWRAAQFLRFLAISLIGLALNQAIVHVITAVLVMPFWLALAVVVATVPAATFLVAKLWVFRGR